MPLSKVVLLSFITAFCRIGKVYYAITTKRLLMMRQHVWQSFNSVANEEDYTRARTNYNDMQDYYLERLRLEDTETALAMIDAADNELLAQRAQELGLTD